MDKEKVTDICLAAPYLRHIYLAIPQIVAIPTPESLATPKFSREDNHIYQHKSADSDQRK